MVRLLARTENYNAEREKMMLLIAGITIMWEGYFIWNFCYPNNLMLWIPLFSTVAFITGYICFKIDEKLDK